MADKRNQLNPLVQGTTVKQFLSSYMEVTAFANDDKIYVEQPGAKAGQHARYISYLNLYLSIGASLGLIKTLFTITGDASAKSFTINHAKDDVTKSVWVRVFKAFGDNAFVDVEIENTDKDNVEVIFGLAPLVGENYTVIVL